MNQPDNGEFEKLFKLHHKALHNLAFNLVRDKDIAKDVVQEVFTKLWQNREKVSFGDQIKHYLFKATSHTSLNYLRAAKRTVPIDHDELIHLHAGPDSNDITYTEFEKKVREAIDRLPPKCKTIYLLSRQEGMKYQEIADTLELSLKTVENQMGIALEKLRTELKPFLPPAFVLILIILSLWAWFL